VGSHKDEFGASALTSSATAEPPLTRREAKAKWEAEQKAEAKAAKRAKPEAAIEMVEVSDVAEGTADLSPRESLKPKLKKLATPKILKSVTSKAGKAPVSSRRRTARVTTMVAMAFVAGLAVATTVPANALLTASDIRAMNLGVVSESEDGQAVQAADGAAASGRDKVSALQWGGTIGGGLYSNVRFVNNPLGKIQWPIRQSCPVSDMYGWRSNPWGSGSEFHHGVDFNPGEGYPIQSIADGVVTTVSNGNAGNYSALGWYVTVSHVINGQKVESSYAHMLSGSIQVKLGQKVRVGDILGQVGSTGASTGAHLHFQLVVDSVMVDPWPWLVANAK
jgi:murein DD-endopeptidase MepM/ murein hydrolase activator NlpD